MISVRKPLWLLGAIAGVSMLSAGAQASVRSIGPTLTRPATVGSQYGSQVRYDAKCKSKGGVTVSPCPVTVGSSNPTQSVTVTAPPSSTITEKDNCATNNVATVTGAGNTYLVTAGTMAGKCKAKFTVVDANGRKVGKATLPITNTGL